MLSLQYGEQGVQHKIYAEHELWKYVRTASRATTKKALIQQAFSLLSRALWSGQARRRLCAAAKALYAGNRSSVPDLLALRPAAGDFDVLLAHFGPVGVRAMLLRDAGLLSGALATVFHGFDMSSGEILSRYMPLYRELMKKGDRQLPISQLWADRLLSWGADPEKIRVLHMGVDVDAFPRLPDKPFNQPLRVLCVGRFTEKKAQLDAIRAIQACRFDVQLELIGGGEMEPLLRAAAGGDSRIHFLGKRTQQEVFAALAEADIFMLPSVTASDGDMEGIPVALMEAMAMGVLVVSTWHSGIPELIQHGHSGLLVCEHDVQGLTATLESLHRGEHDVSAFRRAAREKVLTDFNNLMLDAELEAICSELCSPVELQ